MKILTRTLVVSVALLTLVGSPAAGGELTVTFDSGNNVGGWTYGPVPDFPVFGGNPGAYMHGFVDTFAPQLRTTGSSIFTGDYRANGVSSLGVDLRTISTQFGFAREATLELSSGGTTVYFLGTDLVPQVAEGWKSFDYAIDAQSLTMPAGWTLLGGGDADAAWNTVMTNVTEVRLFYGNPEFFFIFDQWDVGADNARITCTDPWTDLGNSLTGASGDPELVGSGPLTAGSAIDIDLTNALGSTTAWLIVGFAELNASFKGGVLVPDIGAPGFALPIPTSPTGTISISSHWPAGVPSNFSMYLQYWIEDAAGPVGFSASNAVRGTTP